MRIVRTLSKVALLGVGGGATALVFGKGRHRPRRGKGPDIPDSLANDPADPVQAIDAISEFYDDELGVDAQSHADQEAAQDLAALEIEIDEENEDERRDALELAVHGNLDQIEEGQRDVGDLYGVHTPPAVDRVHPDNDATFAVGENWIEALTASAVENGARPELVLSDIVDDEDVYAAPHASDTRDTPVADRGSGGPGGI